MEEERNVTRGARLRGIFRSFASGGHKVLGIVRRGGSRFVAKMRAHPKKTAALGLLSFVLCASLIYPVLVSATDNSWTDRRLDDFFKDVVGHDGRSWASAYEFWDLNISGWYAPFFKFDSTSRYVIFLNCTFSGAVGDHAAIELIKSLHVRFVGCHFVYNGLGILAKNSDVIQVLNSTFDWNGVAINLWNTRDSIVKNNVIAHNGLGIDVEASCQRDTFTLNNFTANLRPAEDKSLYNNWSQDGVGNYWDDYLTRFPLATLNGSDPVLAGLFDPDLGGAFVGSIPYSLPVAVFDLFPLVFVPNTCPALIVNAPIEGSFFRDQAPNYSINVTGFLVTSIWYSIVTMPGDFVINSSQFFYINVEIEGFVDSVAWAGLASSDITIHFYAENWFGRRVEVVRHLVKDTVDPTIVIANPAPNSYFGLSPFDYSLLIEDEHLESVYYSLNGGASNVTAPSLSGTIDAIAWSEVPEGPFYFTVWAVDQAGNQGCTRIRLVRDSAPPIIEVLAPLPGECFGNNSASLNISIIESSLDHVWLEIGSPSMVQDLPVSSSITAVIDPALWLAQPDGPVCLSIYANDSQGDLGVSSVVIRKDTTAAQVTIYVPVSGAIFGFAPPVIVFGKSDPHLYSAWWTMDSLPEIHPLSLENSSFEVDGTTWNVVGDGSHSICIWVRDTCQNIGTAAVDVVKDVSSPSLGLTPMVPCLLFDECSPTFNLTINEMHPISGYYSIGDLGLVAFPVTPGISDLQLKISDSYWAGVGDGLHSITFWCTDATDLVGSVSVNFQKDSSAPLIEILSPTVSTIGSKGGLLIIVNITDPHLADVRFTVDGGLSFYAIPSGSWSGYVDTGIWSQLFVPGEMITLTIFANDTLGHISSKSVTFYCEFEEKTTKGFFGEQWVTNLLLFVIIGLLLIVIIHQNIQTKHLRQLKKR